MPSSKEDFSPPLSSAHKLLQCYHSQWEIGDAAIPGWIPPQPPVTIRPLGNERAVLSDVAHSGRENLHQFLLILLWRHALSNSIMTLWMKYSRVWAFVHATQYPTLSEVYPHPTASIPSRHHNFSPSSPIVQLFYNFSHSNVPAT